MAGKKAKREANYLNDLFLTGRLRFPKLNEPDTFNADKPCYKVGVILEPTALKALKDKLTAFGHRAFPDADLYLPIKRDKKNPEVIFVEAKSSRKNKETGELKRPPVVDARLKPMPASIMIGGGTLAKIKVTAMDYEGTKLTEGRPGVALMIEAVQVKELKEGSDALAGFDADEDGYSADGEQDIEKSSDDTVQGSGDAYDL